MFKQKNIVVKVEDCQEGTLIVSFTGHDHSLDMFKKISKIPVNYYTNLIIEGFDEDFYIKEGELLVFPAKYLDVNNWERTIGDGNYKFTGQVSELDFDDYISDDVQATIPTAECIDAILEKLHNNGKGDLTIEEQEKLDFYSQKILN